MHKQVYHKRKKQVHYMFISAVILLSCIFLAVSNFTSLPGKKVLAEVNQNSMEISKALYEIEEQLNQYGNIFNKLIENHAGDGKELPDNEYKLDILSTQMNAVLFNLVEEQLITEGYFYSLNASNPSTKYELYYNGKTGRTAHITTLMSLADAIEFKNIFTYDNKPAWNTNYNAFSDTVNLQYLIPLYENEKYVGFMGIIIDTDILKDVVNAVQPGRELLLLTETKEVLIHSYYIPGEAFNTLYGGSLSEAFIDHKDQNVVIRRDAGGRYMIYAYTILPSGQIFFAIQELFKMMSEANFLTICVACMAVFIIMIAYRKEVTDKSIFDNLTERVIAFKRNRIRTQDDENRMKSFVAIELGICMVLALFSIYQLFFYKDINVFIISIFIGFIMHFFTYQYIQGKLSEQTKFLYICAMLLVVVGFHVVRGGFGETGSGASLIWMLGVLIYGCFFIKSEYMSYLFGVYVIFISLDIMAELYFLKNIHYERMLVFMNSLMYVGFSLYTAVNIYLKESIADGNRITELLNEVRETQSFLVQQEKMAALGQLISGVAHEINTPIGAVKGAAQTMETGLLPMLRLLKRCEEEFEEGDYDCFFEIIQLASDSIKEMKTTMEIRQAKKELYQYLEEINLPERSDVLEMLTRLEIMDVKKLKESRNILNNPDLSDILKIVVNLSGFIVGIQTIIFAISRVSRIVFALKSYTYTNMQNEIVNMDLIKNIENILVLYHNQIKQGIEVIKEYDEDIKHIDGKPDELAQVWTNLIQNALYAMKEGGVLTICMKALYDNRVEVMIGDSGKGIPEELKERIYDPFFTTKPLGEGSGLGLDISKKVIEAHNGTIRVESSHMEGTRFYVTLPVSKNDEIVVKETVQ